MARNVNYAGGKYNGACYFHYAILEQWNQEKEELAKRYGYTMIDQFNSGPFWLYVMKSSVKLGLVTDDYPYHLAFDREDTNVMSVDQQHDKDRGARKKLSLNDQIATMEPIARKLVEWIKKYGPLVVASFNETRTEKYLNSLTYLSAEFDIPLRHHKAGEIFGTPIHIVDLG